MFRVGMKVVCVEARPGVFAKNGNGKMDGLTAGQVYTVRAVGINPFWGMPAIWLAEIHRKIDAGWEHFGEIGYHQARFRPIVERKTSIEIFQRMLTPKKEMVRV